MIHELLFNLWHNPGVTILEDDADWTHLFELPEFLHPGEERLLQIIMEIGMEYHRITSFTSEVLNQSSSSLDQPELNRPQSGLYLKAFCAGVDEVLEDYRKEIIQLEDKFLEYPQLSLTYILSSIDRYRGLFGTLKSMIRKIQLESLHGCLLLNGLHVYTTCGIDPIVKASNIIIKSINTVFYQHLCNWIICADLVDPHNEFFICDGKVDDENFFYHEDRAVNDSGSTVRKSKIKRPPTVRKFYVDSPLVPSFISEDAAESILFMGRIVWIMKNDPKKQEYTGDYQTKFRRDIWEGKEIEYYHKIQSLKDHVFNRVVFRKTMEECRIKLTKYLRSVMLEEGHLLEHLKLIRDYYGLGQGELFQQFLVVSDTNIKDVPTESLLQHINFLFHETYRKIYGEDDKTYTRFELMTKNNDPISKTNPWLNLELNFEVEWPLHIVFHPQVMGFYNQLFCFLLRLKKTQINLNKLWSTHQFCKQRLDRRVVMLRQNLMFIVNNLQYYMQVDVIEAQFSTLLKAVENASEFEDVIKIHQEFVTTLLSKTFLLNSNDDTNGEGKHVPSKVYKVITKLLEVCDEFCITATTWEPILTEADLEELDTFESRADITVETLLFVLYSLHQKVSGGHLLQLLLHLDFNRYFSRNKTDLNLTGALSSY